MSKCRICPHSCDLDLSPQGFCRGRDNYGKVTALALDPIEKKPLRHFHEGSMILSVGSYGCNMRCGFCQNHHISMNSNVTSTYISPETLAEKATELIPRGNIGVAYTYNEPLIGFEYVLDCAKAVHDRNLKNVVVTNGLICREPLEEILPLIDAFNIDLKGFTNEHYKRIKGDLQTVKNTIEIASRGSHVEVTTLVVPSENDSVEKITAIAEWLSSVLPDIPWHISRYFPNYEYAVSAASVERIREFAEIGRRYLRYVYMGNC